MSFLLWGPYSLGRRFAPRNFLATGTVGSGKTTLVDGLMRTVFAGAAGRSSRALIYDPNQDALSKLDELGLMPRVKILNPFDERCAYWDMAKDITDVLSAQQLANILIPDTPGASAEGRFYDDACRDVLSVVIQVFISCVNKSNWRIADILRAVLYPDNLQYILSFRQTREGAPFQSAERIWTTYFDPKTTDERTRGNMRASLNARLAPFEPVAAAWEAARDRAYAKISQATEDGDIKPFHEHFKPAHDVACSLTDWIAEDSNTILVMGNDESARSAIDPINRAIFTRATELLLTQRQATAEETNEGINQTWFFLDEIRDAGRLDKLSTLITKGRSRGGCVVLTFQDIDGLRSVYGKELSNEIVANCNNIALLKTSSESTAQWCSNMFGKFLVTETDISTGISGAQLSSTETTRKTERSAVYPGDFLFLPLPSDESGLVGFFRDADSSAQDPQKRKLDWRTFRRNQFQPKIGVNYRPVDRSKLRLAGWTDEDLTKRLGLQIVEAKPDTPPTPPKEKKPDTRPPKPKTPKPDSEESTDSPTDDKPFWEE